MTDALTSIGVQRLGDMVVVVLLPVITSAAVEVVHCDRIRRVLGNESLRTISGVADRVSHPLVRSPGFARIGHDRSTRRRRSVVPFLVTIVPEVVCEDRSILDDLDMSICWAKVDNPIPALFGLA